MSCNEAVTAPGRQRTLTAWYGNSNSRPQPSQREIKRSKKATAKTDMMKGQRTLTLNDSVIWNMEESYRLDKDRLQKEYWGDLMGPKQDNIIRVVSKNIQGLGVRVGGIKEDELKSGLVNKNIDIVGIQEPNVNWSKCKNNDKFSERMRSPEWEYVRYSLAYNKNNNQSRQQYGECITLSIDQVTHRVSGSGADERGLGRWSWILLKGKNMNKVRIITVYQPNLCRNSTNPASVYSQHRKFFLDHDIETCSLDMFRQDLITQVKAWLAQRNKIIILIDANEDVRVGPLSSQLEELGLISAIRSRHGHRCPPTQHMGSSLIDDIFVSRGISVKKSGFLPFRDGPGDHRALFSDIDAISLFGGEFQRIYRLPGRRLISSNKKVVEKFNRLLDEKLTLGNIHERMEKLRLRSLTEFTPDMEKEYEKCDNIQCNAFRYADKRCRKLKAGEVCYEPDKIQRHGLIVRLYTYLICKKNNCKVSSSLIKRVAKKAIIDNPFDITVDDAIALRNESRKEYYRLKPNSRTIRNQWMDRKANEKDLEEGEERANFIRQKRQRENLRDSHKRIKYARGGDFRAGTDRVTVVDENGDLTEIFDKAAMENILMQCNKEKFTEANETPFMQPPLLDAVGLDGLTLSSDSILRGTFPIPDGIHQGTADFIHAVKMNENLCQGGPISPDITTEEHQSYWSKARESTQSSLSGLHFGYYKATAKCSKLAQTIASFVSIPYCSGYSPWRFRGISMCQ